MKVLLSYRPVVCLNSVLPFPKSFRIGAWCLLLLGVLLQAVAPAHAQPANDDFLNAARLTGPRGLLSVTTINASKESGEPDHADNPGGNSVWFAWEAPGSGVADITLATGGADSILGIYTGEDMESLTLVVANDDAVPAADFSSSAQFLAVAGTTYFIAVDGYNDGLDLDSFDFKILWSINPLPTNDNFASAKLLVGRSGSTSGTSVAATKQAGEPNHAGNAGGHSVWYSWTSPTNGTALFHTLRSKFNTTLAVYRGASLNALTWLGQSDNFASNRVESALNFAATAGETYWIAVDGLNDGLSAPSGSITLSWVVGVPDNNNFASAFLLPGHFGNSNGYNIFATKETGEPAHASNLGGRSIWYKWIAPANGPCSVNTIGSAADVNTLLGVYTGASVNALTSIGQNDDIDPITAASRVNFNAVAGRTYYFAVDGFNNGAGTASGLTTVTWSFGVPANDEYFSAQTLAGLSGSLQATTLFATKEVGEPDHAEAGGLNSIWYQWQTPVAGVATISLAGSAFNTVLAVYTGGTVDDLTPVAENDDFDLSQQSRVSWPAQAGTTYFIAVDGLAGGAGLVSLSWLLSPRPTLQISKSGGDVIIDGFGPYRLESATALLPGGATVWTTEAGSAPLTLPHSGGQMFFRAVFP